MMKYKPVFWPPSTALPMSRTHKQEVGLYRTAGIDFAMRVLPMGARNPRMAVKSGIRLGKGGHNVLPTTPRGCCRPCIGLLRNGAGGLHRHPDHQRIAGNPRG